jgi:hypothetical protein
MVRHSEKDREPLLVAMEEGAPDTTEAMEPLLNFLNRVSAN